MEHIANILELNKSLVNSLIKVFAMCQLRVFSDKKFEKENIVEDIAINCINCNKDTGLYSKD